MATLKIDAPSGGSVSLVATDTASTVTINVQVDNGLCMVATSATGSVKFATGTTAQRPASPVAGATRWNTTDVALEYYNGTAWITF
jgi:hypothetical protein